MCRDTRYRTHDGLRTHARRYLSDKEVTALMAAAARLGRHGARDAALILIAYRHGLRVSELVSLRWDQLDLQQGLLHVSRLKHGIASVHPVRGLELRALRRLQRDDPKRAYVFVSERRAPLTTDAVRKIIGRAGREAGIEFPVHPHMLRHSASASTVVAGSTSFSITTGETFSSVIKMSGRLAPPFSIPVFSELTVCSEAHVRLVVRSASAMASLIVCSVVAIGTRLFCLSGG